MILGIKGSDEKWEDVIKTLEMIGGINKSNYKGNGVCSYYYIDRITNDIKTTINDKVLCCMSIEEFNEEYPYCKGDVVKLKEGDKVVITDMYWDNIDEILLYKCKSMISNKEYYALDVSLIDSLIDSPSHKSDYNDEESINSSENPVYDVSCKCDKIRVTLKDYQDKVELELCGYELKQENDKTFLIRTPEYPKTYEECCDVLELGNDERHINVNITNIETLENKVFEAFIRLIRCRDAYWKLCNDWKPNPNEQNYSIRYFKGNIVKQYTFGCSSALEFPNEEMHNNFSMFFKDDIELCKELL